MVVVGKANEEAFIIMSRCGEVDSEHDALAS